MIRVRRPGRAPKILTTKGVARLQDHLAAHAKDPACAFDFDRDIYAERAVKRALLRAQHDKCCFCESKVTHVSSGDIEHFRPKAAYRQADGEPLQRPGYFWLAYAWVNLFFACDLCNRRFKKNLFPLIDPATRATGPAAPVASETPLFLDPAADDPELHIGFRDEYPFAINASARGEATWRALGLDREPLAEVRRDHLKLIRALAAAVEALSDGATRREIVALLDQAIDDAAPWASMTRAALGRRPAPKRRAGR